MQIDGTPGFPARGMAGLGVLVRSERGAVIRFYAGRAPARTSNEAEYQALIAALRLIRRDFPNRRVRCLTDSQLLVEQLRGAAAVRAEPIRPLYQTARELIDQFPPAAFELVRIPRDLNRLADALAWEALGGRQALLRRAGVGR
ncbi:ribonuclease HI family protein [Chloroflexus islandicus]|uniref:ribonuclease HI family protein n=1 Tax=Chloroflexus islandicus TaxID=1707952 RepID=UPI000B230FF8|nr:ribonuclease HI family protein [Chloroflexus islandicus]